MSKYADLIRGDKPVPVGTLVKRMSTTNVSGEPLLLCNGALVSRTTYAALFSKISTWYGVGDGSTTFALPDYRGRFLRCLSTTTAQDPDRATRTDRGDGTTGASTGTKQDMKIPSHTHTCTSGAARQYYSGGGVSCTSEGGTTAAESSVTGEVRPINASVKIYIKYK